MKKFAICLFVSAITFSLGFVFYSYSSTGTANNEVLLLMSKFHEAQINKNKTELKKIISDDIQTFHNGQVSNGTKQQFLLNIEQAEIKFINTSFVFTSVVNGKIKVSFQMEITFHSDSEFPSIHRGKYEYSFEKRHNEWKLVEVSLKN